MLEKGRVSNKKSGNKLLAKRRKSAKRILKPDEKISALVREKQELQNKIFELENKKIFSHYASTQTVFDK